MSWRHELVCTPITQPTDGLAACGSQHNPNPNARWPMTWQHEPPIHAPPRLPHAHMS
jgi:hypothetical protein